jgi:hypothetical protein
MTASFDSAWLKWARAVAHAQALDANIERGSQETQTQPVGTIGIEYQPKCHGFSVFVETAHDIPVLWSVILGDIVFNFRASLDHLAWALVQRGSLAGRLTPDQENGVYFPIAMSAHHLTAMLTGRRPKLPGVRRADLAIVRRHQPYLRGKTRAPWHAFAILDRLSNADKHRQIHDVLMIPEINKFKVVECHDCIMTRPLIRAYRRPADIGTEIAFVRVRKTGPNPQVDVDCDIASHPAFHPRLWLHHWLDVTTAEINLLIAEFAEEPAEIEDLGLNIDGIRRAFGTYNGYATTLQRRGAFPPY